MREIDGDHSPHRSAYRFHPSTKVTCTVCGGYFPAAGFEGFASGFEDFTAGVDDFVPGFVVCDGAAGSATILISSASKMRVAFGSMGPAPFSP
jgi:hypothetical protein